jgi:acetyl-CoA C-acetyltransferase
MTMGGAMTGSTPSIAGAAQVIQRPSDRPGAKWGPIELMTEASRAAAEDAGSGRLLARVGWIGVAGGYWKHRNPGELVGRALGCSGAATVLTSISGSAPQELVGIASERIAAGEVDVALVLGGEARYTQQRLKKAGEDPQWELGAGEGTPELIGGFPDDEQLMREFRMFGAAAPAYALMSDSMRAADGESVDDHRTHIAELWARFSDVAARNPYAWDRTPHPPDEIREPRRDNRMIAFPFTKAMVANNNVDMASALVLCSVEVARGFGLATDRLVFPHAVTKAHETWLVAERDELHGSPALAAAGLAAMGHAGIGPDDVDHVDLYACFPSIVRMSARALGFSVDRPLTVTGGLGFAGAPVGNSVGQSIAAMIPLLRAGGWGVVHGNGGNATKHAFGVYSNRPPARFVFEDCQSRADLRPRATLPEDWSGGATVEAGTVVFGRDAPSHLLAAVRPVGALAGSRGWATSTDADLIARAMTVGVAGAAVARTATGVLA